MVGTIIFSIIGVVLGILIDRFFLNKAVVEWQSKFNAADTEIQDIKKQQKKENKKFHQLTQQKGALENKLKTVEEKYIPLTETLNDTISENDLQISDLRIKYRKLEENYTSADRNLKANKKKYKDLQETYTTDMKDSKGWKTKRDRLENEISNWEKKFVYQKKELNSLAAVVEKQKLRISEVSAFTREYKTLEASNRKLTKDIKYWEQKHFDIHHELAKLKVEMESLQSANQEADLRLKGCEIEKDTIVKKIADYKSKFVEVNNLYHILKRKTEKMN